MSERPASSKGRLVEDQAADLPDGTVGDGVLDDDVDELDDGERQALHAAIARSLDQSSEGQTAPAAATSRYRTQSPDTSFEAERILVQRYRTMSPADKLRIFRELSRTTQTLALAGLRRRYPDASPRELQLRLAATRLDPDELRAAFGWSDSE